jgi:hypothetical protein
LKRWREVCADVYNNIEQFTFGDATRDARPHLELNEGMLFLGAKVPDALVGLIIQLSS